MTYIMISSFTHSSHTHDHKSRFKSHSRIWIFLCNPFPLRFMIRNNGIPIIRCISRARVEIFITEERFVSVSNFRASCNRTPRSEWTFAWEQIGMIVRDYRISGHLCSWQKKTFSQNRKQILFKYYWNTKIRLRNVHYGMLSNGFLWNMAILFWNLLIEIA